MTTNMRCEHGFLVASGLCRECPEAIERERAWVPRRLHLQRWWRSKGYRYAPTLKTESERRT